MVERVNDRAIRARQFDAHEAPCPDELLFRRVPCVEKLERLVGYRPQTPLHHIIEVTAENLRKDLSGSEFPNSVHVRIGTYA